MSDSKVEFKPFTKVKTFSVTSFRDRGTLGEEITEWIMSNNIEPVDCVVTQSSDRQYHCLSITIFAA